MTDIKERMEAVIMRMENVRIGCLPLAYSGPRCPQCGSAEVKYLHPTGIYCKSCSHEWDK